MIYNKQRTFRRRRIYQECKTVPRVARLRIFMKIHVPEDATRKIEIHKYFTYFLKPKSQQRQLN